MTRTDEAFEYLEMILNEHKLCQRLLDENIRLNDAIKNIKAEIENRRDEIKEVDEKSKTISMKGYVLGLDRALEIINGKGNKTKGDKE